MSNTNTPTDLVQIWKDTFTLVYRPNVARMGYEDAHEYAKKAADLHVQTLKNEVTPPPKVKVRVEKFGDNARYFHFDKECSDVRIQYLYLVQYLKDNVQGLGSVVIDRHASYVYIVCQNFVHKNSFLNDIKTAIEMFFRKNRMEVEYVE
jgi:hypothetical protein